MLIQGARGKEVQDLQKKLHQLGYEVKVDGIFGPITRWAVLNVQAMFGYNIDGVVGEGTQKLLDTQVRFGWNFRAGDAQDRALKAQGLIKDQVAEACD